MKKLTSVSIFFLLCWSATSAQSFSVTDSLMLKGAWVPANSSQIDFTKLPRLSKSDHVVVNDVRDQDGHRVNQHNYLFFHDGLYWAMWSDGPGVARKPAGQHRNTNPGHDQAHQKVSYATSTDGLHWSPAKDITDSPAGDTGWIARGFWEYKGRLLALVTRFRAPGYQGDGLSLHAFEWDKNRSQWQYLGVVYDNAMNNFPPQQLPNGEWMMSRRDSLQNVHTLFGGLSNYNSWQSAPAVAYRGKTFKAEEPYWWVLSDHKTIMAMYRDNAKSRRIYRAFSTDNGRTWTDAVKTNFPDATSKFCGLRLSNGRYVLVSNPNPEARDPLTLAISDDGVTFTKMVYLVGDRVIDYPHVMEHDGYLFVAFGGAKQSVELIRIKIDELDKIQMPANSIAKQ